jgi:hypothetical protein
MTETTYLTTRQFADILGVTTSFVLAEYRDGRLTASAVISRPNHRTVYRFLPSDVVDYCTRFSPRTLKLTHVRERLGLPALAAFHGST